MKSKSLRKSQVQHGAIHPRQLVTSLVRLDADYDSTLRMSVFSLCGIGPRYRRPREPAQRNYCASRRHASVFQQHDPDRKRSPRTPKCAQMPHDVSGDNAHSPDDDQQRRGRRQKWQQPEKIPWEYGGCAQERCCHWPGKLRPETVRALCVLARLQSLIRRAPPAQPATAEAPPDRVPQTPDH